MTMLMGVGEGEAAKGSRGAGQGEPLPFLPLSPNPKCLKTKSEIRC